MLNFLDKPIIKAKLNSAALLLAGEQLKAMGEMKHMDSIKQIVRSFIKDESGQDLIEYALVAGLIGLGAVTAMSTLSNSIGSAFSSVGSKLNSSI